MKKTIVQLLLLFPFFTVLSQEKETISIFNKTKNWKTEIINFPIDWAPNLKLTGFEELLFMPNWSNSINDEFWSLVIGWNVNATIPLSLKEIEHNFKSYFDGLMKPNHWATNFPEPEVQFKKNIEEKFVGEMKFFDGFYTGKIITVHVLGEQLFCKKSEKTIVVFRLSPKEYHHKIWENLNEIKLKKPICNSIKNDEK